MYHSLQGKNFVVLTIPVTADLAPLYCPLSLRQHRYFVTSLYVIYCFLEPVSALEFWSYALPLSPSCDTCVPPVLRDTPAKLCKSIEEFEFAL